MLWLYGPEKFPGLSRNEPQGRLLSLSYPVPKLFKIDLEYIFQLCHCIVMKFVKFVWALQELKNMLNPNMAVGMTKGNCAQAELALLKLLIDVNIQTSVASFKLVFNQCWRMR